MKKRYWALSRRASVALSFGVGLFGACSASTGGERVMLANRVEASSLEFRTAFGWSVTLEQALVSIGSLRYFDGAPVARGSLGIDVAHAHPGHYAEGGALGEMLAATSVDLAGGSVALTASPGVTGTARSARFAFQSPPVGPFADALGASVVSIVGTATSGTESRRFRLVASVEDVLDAAGHPEIAGCAFDDGVIDADGSVTLAFVPSVWFDQVDFSVVPASPDGAPVDVDRALTAHKAFVRGLKKAAAYTFRFEAGPG